MPTLKVHHIGYLVKKIDAAIQAFTKLDYVTMQPTVYDEIRKVHICFMQKDGYVIELIAPASEDSVVSGLIKKCKNSPYHICYESADFDKDYQMLMDNGYASIDAPTPAPALSGRRVVFLMNASMGMIELLGP